MPFNIIYPLTSMDAEDVNQNFLHIGQGTIYPRDASSKMQTKNDTYNLGSSTTTWKNLNCYNIFFDSLTSTDHSLPYVILNYEVQTITTRIEISGLNGDSNDPYEIYIYFKMTTGSIEPICLYFNGDTTTSKVTQYLYNVGINIFPGTDTGTNYNFICYGNGFLKARINSKTGYNKTCEIFCVTLDANDSFERVEFKTISLNDSITTLTSLVVDGGEFKAGTHYILIGNK